MTDRSWVMRSFEINSSFEPYAFSVVNWTCANANLSMAHEIGHNMGLNHDRPNAGNPSPAFPYAYGYAVNGLARDEGTVHLERRKQKR